MVVSPFKPPRSIWCAPTLARRTIAAPAPLCQAYWGKFGRAHTIRSTRRRLNLVQRPASIPAIKRRRTRRLHRQPTRPPPVPAQFSASADHPRLVVFVAVVATVPIPSHVQHQKPVVPRVTLRFGGIGVASPPPISSGTADTARPHISGSSSSASSRRSKRSRSGGKSQPYRRCSRSNQRGADPGHRAAAGEHVERRDDLREVGDVAVRDPGDERPRRIRRVTPAR